MKHSRLLRTAAFLALIVMWLPIEHAGAQRLPGDGGDIYVCVSCVPSNGPRCPAIAAAFGCTTITNGKTGLDQLYASIDAAIAAGEGGSVLVTQTVMGTTVTFELSRSVPRKIPKCADLDLQVTCSPLGTVTACMVSREEMSMRICKDAFAPWSVVTDDSAFRPASGTSCPSGTTADRIRTVEGLGLTFRCDASWRIADNELTAMLEWRKGVCVHNGGRFVIHGTTYIPAFHQCERAGEGFRYETTAAYSCCSPKSVDYTADICPVGQIDDHNIMRPNRDDLGRLFLGAGFSSDRSCADAQAKAATFPDSEKVKSLEVTCSSNGGTLYPRFGPIISPCIPSTAPTTVTATKFYACCVADSDAAANTPAETPMPVSTIDEQEAVQTVEPTTTQTMKSTTDLFDGSTELLGEAHSD